MDFMVILLKPRFPARTGWLYLKGSKKILGTWVNRKIQVRPEKVFIIFEQRVVIKFHYDSGLMIEGVLFLLANGFKSPC